MTNRQDQDNREGNADLMDADQMGDQQLNDLQRDMSENDQEKTQAT